MRLSLTALAIAAVLGSASIVRAAPAFIVVDMDSGTVLGQRDSGHIWHPASVTKLMTAYLTFKALQSGQIRMTSPVIVSKNALAEPPSKMGFKVGTAVTVDNALKMVLVHSANDIAVALAEAVGGSEARFVAEMNAEARRLGMASTHYDNPNGLPSPGQLTNARDLAVLARAVWTDFPQYRAYFGIPAIKAGRKVLRSENSLLLRYPGTVGMKTGFICDSGFNMVAAASRNGHTLMAVVLGASSSLSRAQTAAKLLDMGFTGASFGFPRTSLASFRAGPQPGPVANLHDEVCGGMRMPTEDDDPVLVKAGPITNPVIVFTGKTDPLPGSAGLAAPVKASADALPDTSGPAKPVRKAIPMPRLRPSGSGAAASAGTLVQ
ncbi:MAG: D-alanyl-D-alanine carboxypeptidase [Rhizobiales bacterium]|nr:D-alanyl-D-alanine carboxypeptidase [Hyphomicrobiales bacterium]